MASDGTDWGAAIALAAENAPYLKRLIERQPQRVEQLVAAGPRPIVDEALTLARSIERAPPALDDGMKTLRQAKAAVHLATAIADLGRAWPLAHITGALTEFADAALRAALFLAAQESAARGDLVLPEHHPARGPVPGIVLVAMGKMGAGELNYSSDIDFSVFFDAEQLAQAKAREPRVAAVRLVAPLVRALEEVTADGYVFRTDLRLRPDPGSTPVAVSIASAEHYYQTLGQNWERAAFIKARAAAGDSECGRAFLASLEPFIWRKHLDFAAVEDVHSIKRQILSAHKSADLGDPVFDVKLGRGGIRDIELFAQTQQLILGGRNKNLRVRGTIEALDALTESGAIVSASRDALARAYGFFREVEHRIQMLEDAQTHRVPVDPEVRAHVAALAGFADLAAFDAALVEQRAIVAEIDHQLFGRGASLADPLGSLIFTGVEDHQETLDTIAKLGFQNAVSVSQSIRGWHHGRIRAMRSERARELLTRLTPKLLRALSGAGDPDHAFSRFSAFFSALTSGVQVLALLDARPALLDMLARLLSVAPRLADTLAQRPALLDTLIEPRFAAPFTEDASDALSEDLADRLRDVADFEARMNTARRFHREERFRIGVQVLEERVAPIAAGSAFTRLAEVCVMAMVDAAQAETERLFGPQPGCYAVFALGKFGGSELTDTSDLDIMLVYDAAADAAGSSAPDYYARLTQRLISALSAPTEEGALYEIDTKLRPSGSKGPVAVRLSSFQRYYVEEAWTWELQALTRLRPVAGDASLSDTVMRMAHETLMRRRDAAKTLADVAAMRARMDAERPAKSAWDLKLVPGGLTDIEFVVQALQLIHAADAPDVLSPNTGAALARLAAAGCLDADVATRLHDGWRLWTELQQVLRLCMDNELGPGDAPGPLQRRLTSLLRADDLESALRGRQGALRADFVRLIGSVSDGTKLSGR
ncbi:MAG: bifunctional [glutamine synthetase] adenylyltransferase/[glutamine synthetase]-adenylyl-L-tyrosine phosphorylase [Hyphomonadaceae bacterium]|nr:bifunctional [glutamine synthetase] adenylyltransferase/[glutamine synthetase]-adenylyl-L-tyrosine phosphorylase [Hyphomonadaceae bacterium]